jgi:hypothetical protein
MVLTGGDATSSSWSLSGAEESAGAAADQAVFTARMVRRRSA